MGDAQSPIAIRRATAGDRIALEEICRQSFEGIYLMFSTRSVIRNENVHVATSGDVPVGFVVTRTTELAGKRIGYIFWLAVQVDARRKGFAGALIDFAVDDLRGRGMQVVYASIEDDNPESQSLFRRKGFESIQRIRLKDEYRWNLIRFYFRFLIAPHELIFRKILR